MSTIFDTYEQYNCKIIDICFPRSKEIQQKYDEHMRLLKNNGISVHSYIMAIVFNNNELSLPYRFRLNDFPYDIINDDIKHVVCWIHPDYVISMDYISFILNSVNIKHIIFKNAPANMSIPTICHYHIFVNSIDANKLCNNVISSNL